MARVGEPYAARAGLWVVEFDSEKMMESELAKIAKAELHVVAQHKLTIVVADCGGKHTSHSSRGERAAFENTRGACALVVSESAVVRACVRVCVCASACAS